MLFDYLSVARRARVSQEDLERLCTLMRAEFPGDQMMVELHVLRALLSVERGDITLQELLSQEITG